MYHAEIFLPTRAPCFIAKLINAQLHAECYAFRLQRQQLPVSFHFFGKVVL